MPRPRTLACYLAVACVALLPSLAAGSGRKLLGYENDGGVSQATQMEARGWELLHGPAGAGAQGDRFSHRASATGGGGAGHLTLEQARLIVQSSDIDASSLEAVYGVLSGANNPSGDGSGDGRDAASTAAVGARLPLFSQAE